MTDRSRPLLLNLGLGTDGRFGNRRTDLMVLSKVKQRDKEKNRVVR